MGKKFGFLLGLLAGGAAAHVAYRQLDDAQKEQLKADLQDKVDIAKDRAVDYAFYASDAWADFKETFAEQSESVSDKVKSATAQFENQHFSKSAEADQVPSEDLRSELADVATAADDDSDDIVLNSEDTFGGADVSAVTETEATPAKEAASTQEDAPEEDTPQEPEV